MVIRSLPILLFIATLIFGCHSDVVKEPRPVELVLGQIGGTWHATRVMLSGVAQSGYETYNITFSEGANDQVGYEMSIWPVVAELPYIGTLKLGNNINSELQTQDGLVIQYAISGSKLLLTYNSRIPVTGDPKVDIVPTWVIEYEKVN